MSYEKVCMSKEVGSGGSVRVDGESGSGGKPAGSSNCCCAPAVTKVHLAVSGEDQLQHSKPYLIVTRSAKGDWGQVR